MVTAQTRLIAAPASFDLPVRQWPAEVRVLLEPGHRADAQQPWRPYRVRGGPGTGKTSLLVDVAVSRLLDDGADPESVLVLTANRRAATVVRNEITRRVLAAASPDGSARTGAALREPLVRTVHSYAFAVLRLQASAHGNPPPRLITGSEQDVILRELLAGDLEDGAAYWPESLRPALATDGFAQALRDLLMRAAERGLGPEDLTDLGRRHKRPEWVAAGRAFAQYEQTMLLRGAVGIDAPEAGPQAVDAAELVGSALSALAVEPRLLAEQRARIRCLLVDDAQHLDPQAAQLVRLIGTGADLVVVAADPDQSIYSFRGASPRFFAELPGGRDVVLTQGHRCRGEVNTVGRILAARLPGARPHPYPDAAPGDVADPPDGGTAAVRVFSSAAKEATAVADLLRRAHLFDGVPWSEMAVIVRSVPRALPALRRAFSSAGVPVVTPTSDLPLYRQRAVEAFSLALRAAAAREPLEPDDVVTLLSGPIGAAGPGQLRRLRRGIRRLHEEDAITDPPSSAGNPCLAPGTAEARTRPEAGETADALECGEVVPQEPIDSTRPRDLDSARSPGEAGSSSGEAGSSPGEIVSSPGEAGSSSGETGVSSGDAGSLTDPPDSLSALAAALADPARAEPYLAGLTEFEAEPLARTLKVVRAARIADRAGEGVEETLWRAWQASGLERSWLARSLRGDRSGEQADRDLDAMLALFEAAASYTDNLPAGGLDGFLHYLGRLQIPRESRTPTAAAEAVQLLSAHSAAGREWEVVAVPGVLDGLWPSLRSRGSVLGTPALVDLLDGIDAHAVDTVSRNSVMLADERRLLLVACTRARNRLLLTAVEDGTGDASPSRFVPEVADALGGYGAAHDEHGEAADEVPLDGGVRRLLSLPSMVAELRAALTDPQTPADRRDAAARLLAELAAADVPGAAPQQWYGLLDPSSDAPLWTPDRGPRTLSPSNVDALSRCSLRWMLERHGGRDGDAEAAVTGTLVHTLVQAVAGELDHTEVTRALHEIWDRVSSPAAWFSDRELRRAESMLVNFRDWLEHSRRELTEAAVEVDLSAAVPPGADAEGRPDTLPVTLVGRIDRLETDDLGRPVVVDVKTGKTVITAAEAAEHPQLAAYQLALLLGGVDGVPAGTPGGGRLVYVASANKKTGAAERVQEPLTPEQVDEWIGVVRTAARSSIGPGFVAATHSGCSYCTLTASCPAQLRGKAVTDD
ncbi:ATP-dependent DNA helicase [Gordonia iterans]|uniref:DNA 3'-5' helicase n=1 Tax=Gordonia iterans TaxID=1004901 RepID=A0A2S0KIF3_9ACTN|nr:ATP-dependent DNA helicase [Gordonia iterans]AVM01426.1 ATP-dependent DNA helicase [Gordonia iterans]